MKRILGTVVAFAVVLAFGGVSGAAVTVFDVSGTGFVDTVSAYAPSPPGYFQSYFAAGSSISVDITGSAATLNAGTLNIIDTLSFGATGSIDRNMVASVSGATGVLSGNNILWSTPASISATGTFDCVGPICGLLGLTQGVFYPIAGLPPFLGETSLSSSPLGEWDLNASLNVILGSQRLVTELGGVTPPPGPGLPSEWYVFGRIDLGAAVPEPSTLLLLGLATLGLAITRHRARER